MKSNQSIPKLPKGVLKIKAGYNPNSSSIGSVIYAFPLLYIAITGILALTATLISPAKKKKKS